MSEESKIEAEYHRVCEQAWEEFERACAPAREKYERVCDQAMRVHYEQLAELQKEEVQQ